MNEEATTVQATQPPSSLTELIFRRFCFSSKLDLGKPSILKKIFDIIDIFDIVGIVGMFTMHHQ